MVSGDLFYRLLADAVLLLHAGFVVFVVAGLLIILIGRLLDLRWIRNLRFRILHLLAILVVVAQTWAEVVCPLTTWEMMLRAKAGDATYTGSFVAHWVESMLYVDAPHWVFVLVYSVFALLVVATWIWIPPRGRRRRAGNRGGAPP